MKAPIVIIESPYVSPDRQSFVRNRNYLKAAVMDSISRGEAPFAGHGFYTIFLNDRDPSHRRLGMWLSRQFLRCAELVAVYADLGTSAGMLEGIKNADRLGIPIEHRLIGSSWEPHSG